MVHCDFYFLQAMQNYSIKTGLCLPGARQRHRDWEDDREIWVSGFGSAGVDWTNHHHPQQSKVCKLTGWSPAAASGLQHLQDRGETTQVSV